MIRRMPDILLVVAVLVAVHLVLGGIVGRLATSQPAPEGRKIYASAELGTLREEAIAVRTALILDQAMGIDLDELVLAKHLRLVARERLGLAIELPGWEALEVEFGFSGEGWVARGDVVKKGERWIVHIRERPVDGRLISVEPAK